VASFPLNTTPHTRPPKDAICMTCPLLYPVGSPVLKIRSRRLGCLKPSEGSSSPETHGSPLLDHFLKIAAKVVAETGDFIAHKCRNSAPGRALNHSNAAYRRNFQKHFVTKLTPLNPSGTAMTRNYPQEHSGMEASRLADVMPSHAISAISRQTLYLSAAIRGSRWSAVSINDASQVDQTSVQSSHRHNSNKCIQKNQ
jgi:hypothetical protein